MTTLPISTPNSFPLIAWRCGIAKQLLMLSVFIGVTLLIMPLSLFVYDNDEGINVIKAVLVADGYPLYTQTWSDQPPVFTHLLQLVFALFGETMVVARLLVLALTALFVWAYTATIRLWLGDWAAWAGLLLLMLSDNFLRLSVSVMIGLPALSLAMVSLYLVQCEQHQLQTSGTVPGIAQSWRLLPAALLLALAMQTKVFTVVLLPVMGLDLIDFGRDWMQERSLFWRKLRRALLWGGLVAVGYLLISLYYNALNIEMLLGSHLSSTVQSAYEEESSWAELRTFLRYDYGHLLLAALGVIIVVVRRLWHGLLPLGWLAVAFLLLLNHRPIWYHHYPLIAIPLCWLGAYVVWAVVEQVQSHSKTQIMVSWPGILSVVFALAVAVSLIYWRGEQSVPYYNQRTYDQTIVDLLAADAGQTNWVFSDRATYPFYAGLPVPPEIAVFSRKRFFGENLDTQILVTVMQRYHPEQVLLTRFKDELLADAGFAGYLDAHYTKVQEHPDYVYYRLR